MIITFFCWAQTQNYYYKNDCVYTFFKHVEQYSNGIIHYVKNIVKRGLGWLLLLLKTGYSSESSEEMTAKYPVTYENVKLTPGLQLHMRVSGYLYFQWNQQVYTGLLWFNLDKTFYMFQLHTPWINNKEEEERKISRGMLHCICGTWKWIWRAESPFSFLVQCVRSIKYVCMELETLNEKLKM